jgi:hypothetical protein
LIIEGCSLVPECKISRRSTDGARLGREETPRANRERRVHRLVSADAFERRVDADSVKKSTASCWPPGQIDLDTDRGQHVWRLMKGGSLGFSFGYITTGSISEQTEAARSRASTCSRPRPRPP